ncbi:MAG: hypothetical protein C0403_01645 [Desulfobacterium sp.]|nr:hypothetical protein [Desulfobacterium sp.]
MIAPDTRSPPNRFQEDSKNTTLNLLFYDLIPQRKCFIVNSLFHVKNKEKKIIRVMDHHP